MLTAGYDANVLYPASLRDLLIRLGQTGLVRARWTERILDEMTHAILRTQPHLARLLRRTRHLMNEAIPNVLVGDYESLIPDLRLPDTGDRHVLAAAIRAKAEIIVTSNLRDFPRDALEPHGIKAMNPDEFLCCVLEMDPAQVVAVLEDQARALTRPVTTLDQLIDRLAAVGLAEATEALRRYVGEPVPGLSEKS